MSINPCVFVSPSLTTSPAPLGGMCFEEDYELEDWDLEDDPADGLDSTDDTNSTDKASQGLQAAVKAEREKRQALEKQLADIQAAKEAADEASKAEAGQFRELYEKLKAEREAELKELKALKGEKKARIEALTAKNTERLEALPEDWRDLIPEGLTPSAMAKQLDKIEKRLTDSEDRPAGGVRGKPPKKHKPVIPEACKASARHHGRDPEKWFPIWKKTVEGQKWLKAQKS